MITVDKNPAETIVIQELKEEKHMPESIESIKFKYLNNIVEQGHQFIKKAISLYVRIKVVLLQSFWS
ncbi:hypothetical protein CN899_26435 [Bacillus thuringiensis]|uniref:DDE domain-containing protein n=1 Tax=Bacillus thuringiensis TaxID=1428 RepID=A0A9X7GH23_BACTU|nr:hypothetical protein CN899_26435 [Bacillus thuringiensis]